MSMNERYAIRVRPYGASDREFVFSLASRLLIGMASWRDSEKSLEAVQNWITNSVEQHGTQTMVFVAENEKGKQVGFASVSHSSHFTCEKQAYIGELAVDESAEDAGIGRALVVACEQWAKSHGYKHIVLETGAANTRARGFYQRLGFLEEDVKLVKRL